MKNNNLISLKKVSVVMSCYNTPEKYLKLALESVLCQTYKNIEYIIVNNGGNNLDQLNTYANKDNRIHIINNVNTVTLPEALNIALKNVTGDYIARMDSDDFSLPDRIEKQVKFLEKNSDIDICGMYVKIFDAESRYAGYPWTSPEDIKASLFFSNEIYHPTIMLRKKVFENWKMFYRKDYNYSEDFDLWNRCCEKGKISIIPEVGLYYRIHSLSTSKVGNKTQRDSKEKVLINNLKNLGFSDNKLNELKGLIIYDEKITVNNLISFVNEIVENNRISKYYNENSIKKTLNLAILRSIMENKRYNEITLKQFISIIYKSKIVDYMIKKYYNKICALIQLNDSLKRIPDIKRQELM